MGLERVCIALVRGFDIPRGPMREDALDWVKEQEDRRESRQRIVMVATTVCARCLVSGSPTVVTLVVIAPIVIEGLRSQALELGINEAGGTLCL